MKNRTGQTGYTLTEIMVSIVIMVVLTAVAINQLSSPNRKNLVNNAKEMLADLSLMQVKALNDCSHYLYVTVTSGVTSYQIRRFGETNCDIGMDPADVMDGTEPYEQVTKLKALPSNIQIVSSKGCCSAADFIIFTTSGTPSGGWVEETCNVVLRNTESDECRGIQILPTGKTSLLTPDQFNANPTVCPCD